MSKVVLSIFVFSFLALTSFAVSPPCNYIQHQGFSCYSIEPSIQYYYHIASKTCQPFMYLGCGGNRNRFPSRIGCMQICQPGSIKIGQGTRPSIPNIGQGTQPGSNNNNNNNNNNIGQGTFPGEQNSNPGIGQGARPGGSSGAPGIGQGTGPGSRSNLGIGQGAQPINNNIGQGARPSSFGSGNGVNLFMRNNAIGNGAEPSPSSSMPTIGQGTNSETPIGDGTSANSGIGHGTNPRLTNLNIQDRVENGKVDIFNPFHPGPVKTGNGTWPAPAAPPSQLSTKDFVNGYAQMCDTSFGVNIKIPTSCGASDSCPPGYQCAGRFCCPTKETACSQRSDSGKELKEQEHVGRYAYEPELKTCLRFSYFGAEGNFNNFKTFNDCMRFCAS